VTFAKLLCPYLIRAPIKFGSILLKKSRRKLKFVPPQFTEKGNQKMNRHYFRRTVIQVEVLSDDKDRDFGNMDLDDIAYSITDGGCRGTFRVVSDKRVTGKEMAKLVRAQGSDPEFFQIDDKGRSINMLEDIVKYPLSKRPRGVV
jgi:hypothetical protein